MYKRKYKSKKEAYDYLLSHREKLLGKQARVDEALDAYSNALKTCPTPKVKIVAFYSKSKDNEWYEAFPFDNGNVPFNEIRLNSDGSISI